MWLRYGAFWPGFSPKSVFMAMPLGMDVGFGRYIV
jgi:hypothetical protein